MLQRAAVITEAENKLGAAGFMVIAAAFYCTALLLTMMTVIFSIDNRSDPFMSLLHLQSPWV